MLKQKRTVEIHPEFIARRHGKGLKILAPEFNHKTNAKNPNTSIEISIQKLLDLPLNVYFLNSDSVIQEINFMTVKNMAFTSHPDAIGRSIRDVSGSTEMVNLVLAHDQQVMKTKNVYVFDESGIINDNPFNATSIKVPWFGNNDNIIGVIGFSIQYGNMLAPNLFDMLQIFNNLQLLNAVTMLPSKGNDILQSIINIKLSKREQECVFYLKQGKRIKGIARELGLSPKTIRQYIEHIKMKLNVNYIDELTEKLIREDY